MLLVLDVKNHISDDMISVLLYFVMIFFLVVQTHKKNCLTKAFNMYK